MRLGTMMLIGATLATIGATAGVEPREVSRATSSPNIAVHSDFNGDGFEDLAIGTPEEGVGAQSSAGAVSILYGSSAGAQADAPDDQFWTQDSPGVKTDATYIDRFGFSVVAADFNGDGFADLATGAIEEDVGGQVEGGAVAVLFGSSAGLQADDPDDQLWSQDSPGVKDKPEFADWFGAVLAAGDFNADGFADLAVGTPTENLGGTDTGVVNILYGSANGLQADDPEDQVWTQARSSVKGRQQINDYFGASLASRDFNADGFADLAIGVPGKDSLEVADAGGVSVLFGSAVGLQASAPDDQLWRQGVAGVIGDPERADTFGASLTPGDFNSDGFADLAIGVPGEGIGEVNEAGAVAVLFGSTRGLQASDDELWSQASSGVKGTVEFPDRFGSALGAGDFNGDGYADLAASAPLESSEGESHVGGTSVLYGGVDGLQAVDPDDQLWSQDSPSVKENTEASEEFGSTLAVHDLNDDGFADLMFGVPEESQAGEQDQGAVQILYGSVEGLQAANPDDQLWIQDSPSVKEESESLDLFGSALA